MEVCDISWRKRCLKYCPIALSLRRSNSGRLLVILALVVCACISHCDGYSVVSAEVKDKHENATSGDNENAVTEQIPGRYQKQLVTQNTMYSFEYQKGERIVGDELLVSSEKSYIFPTQDVRVTIAYPGSQYIDPTHIITSYILWVSQDSKINKGYQMRGGIFCHYLDLKIEAEAAASITIEFLLYGIDNIMLPGGLYSYNRLCNNTIGMPLAQVAKPVIIL